MNDQIITYLFTNVSFGALFVWLLMDTRKECKNREERYEKTLAEGRDREDKYRETIDKLADKIAIVVEIRDDVDEIKTKLKSKLDEKGE